MRIEAHRAGEELPFMLTVEAIAPYLPGEAAAVFCAVSGGVDSMVLLHLLWTWTESRHQPLTALHFNHQLRPTAIRDEELVRRLCGQWGIPLVTGRADVGAYAARHSLSIEEAARTLRYGFFRREMEKNFPNPPGGQNIPFPDPPAAAEKKKVPVLCTAHHLEDNAETVLLNLVRGTGIRGLAGIRPYRDRICRPLLNVTRAEIGEYARAHQIPYVTDETNLDPDAAARNFLRLRVLPLLREVNRKADEHIHAAAGKIAALDNAMEAEARRMAEGVIREQSGLQDPSGLREGNRITLPRRTVWEAPEVLRPYLLMWALEKTGAGRKDWTERHIEAIFRLLSDDSGRKRSLHLPHGIAARYDGQFLTLETLPPPLKPVALRPGVPCQWDGLTLTLLEQNTERNIVPEQDGAVPESGACILLRARLKGEQPDIEIRPCPGAGRLTLPDSTGSRTVKRLCMDRKLPLRQRSRLPAVYIAGRLAAVWPLGTDRAFCPQGGAYRVIIVQKTESCAGPPDIHDGTPYQTDTP